MYDFKTVEASENLRTLTLENGNKIHFKRTDPYGFWTVNYDKGQVPLHLQGHYTSYDRAAHAVKEYLEKNDKKPEAKEIKPEKKKTAEVEAA